MTHLNIFDPGSVGLLSWQRWQNIKEFVIEAWHSPMSCPAGRALVLRVAYPVTAATALATAQLFNMYSAAKARVAFIDAHNLSLSPPDPTPELVAGMVGAGVTLVLVGAMLEVATGKRIAELPGLAAARCRALVKSGRARFAAASAMAAAAKLSAAAPANR
jgi:hypothetical protein